MKRIISSLLLLISLATCSMADNKDSVMYISGEIYDSFTGAPVNAKVRILRADSSTIKQANEVDSVFVDTLNTYKYQDWNTKRDRVDYDGYLPKEKGNYIIKAEHEDYETLYFPLTISKIRNNINGPELKMKRLIHKSVNLDGVEIRASKVQMVYRGDTIVYDASAFILPEGSMLDGLIRQLPGVQLSSDGEITVNGEHVDNLTLNGKDFFKGKNKVMLENLPYYTVKEVKAYKKRDEKSETLDLPEELEDKMLVLDVVLKREFQRGYLANAEAGAGTENRWTAKLFSLMYGNRYRLSLFGNANNVNEERTPGQDGGWDPTKTTNGLITTHQVGVHHEISDKFNKWSNRLEGIASWKDADNDVVGKSETYRTTGSIFNNYHTSSLVKEKNYELTNTFELNKPFWLYSNIAMIYSTSDGDNTSADSTWQTSPANSNSSTSSSKYHRFMTYGYFLFNHSLWSNGGIVLSLNGQYSRANPCESFGLSRTNYYTQASNTTDLRNKYSKNASWQYLYVANASIRHYFTKNSMQINLSFDYKQNMMHNDNLNYRLDSLGGRYERETFILPSTCDSLALATDVNNSYQYTELHRKYQTQLQIFKVLIRKKIDKEGNETRDCFGNINLSIPVTFTDENINFWRRGKDGLPCYFQNAGRSRVIFEPKLGININLKRTKGEFNLSRQENNYGITNLINMSNTSNPLYMTFTNTALKNPYSYNANMKLDVRCDSIPLSYWIKVELSSAGNSVGSRRWYNSNTGGYVSMSENIKGKWNGYASGSSGLNWQFGKQKRWNATLDGFLNYTNSVDFALQTVSFDGTPTLNQLHELTPSSELSTVRTLNTNLQLKLNYKYKLFTAGLTGRIDGRHSRSDCEDFTDLDTYEYKYGANCTYTTPKTLGSITIATDYNIFVRRGYDSSEINKTFNIWNASISKAFIKGSLVAKISAFDILHQVSNIGYTVNAQGHTERRYNSIPRYVMFTLGYNFSKKPKKDGKS